MISLCRLSEPAYGPNLDNFDQYKLVTRDGDGITYTDPITAPFTEFVDIEFRCTSSRIEVYVDGVFKTSSESNITSSTIYPYFRASNADQNIQKAMVIDWVRIIQH